MGKVRNEIVGTGNQRKNQDYPNYSSVEISLITLNRPGYLRRFALRFKWKTTN